MAVSQPGGGRTSYREALRRAWEAAECVAHEDAAGRYESRDYYIEQSKMWAAIALAEKGSASAWCTGTHLNIRPPTNDR